MRIFLLCPSVHIVKYVSSGPSHRPAPSRHTTWPGEIWPWSRVLVHSVTRSILPIPAIVYTTRRHQVWLGSVSVNAADWRNEGKMQLKEVKALTVTRHHDISITSPAPCDLNREMRRKQTQKQNIISENSMQLII